MALASARRPAASGAHRGPGRAQGRAPSTRSRGSGGERGRGARRRGGWGLGGCAKADRWLPLLPLLLLPATERAALSEGVGGAGGAARGACCRWAEQGIWLWAAAARAAALLAPSPPHPLPHRSPAHPAHPAMRVLALLAAIAAVAVVAAPTAAAAKKGPKVTTKASDGRGSRGTGWGGRVGG